MNTLTEFQNWFLSQCNGDWEHTYGVKIENLDNPGWIVTIELIDTEFENMLFTPSQHGLETGVEPDKDWWTAKIEDKNFIAYCSPLHLETVLRIFLDWTKTKAEPAG